MVEWFKAAVLKTAEGRPSLGSNPSSSAIFILNKKSLSKAKSKFASKTCKLFFFFTPDALFAEKPQERGIFLRGVAGGRCRPAHGA